jgi:small subunit ribosomal protein S16
VAVKIRLKRFGKKHAPFYRVVVMDSRSRRDGRAIEEIGKYHPTEEPSVIVINSERAQYWLGVGAQPTPQVAALLKLTGDWGIFTGEKGATNTVKPQIAKVAPDEKIKAAAGAAEKAKATKAKATEDAVKAKAEEDAKAAVAAKEAAAEAAAAAVETAAEEIAAEEIAAVEDAPEVAEDPIADESHEVPSDEGAEVEIEVAEGDPSDADDKVEGIIDEEK